MKVFIGTSGWNYKEWVGGPFYDSYEKQFTHYSEVFQTAEIDSTFYAFPSFSFIRGLSNVAPKDFKFSMKIPRVISHKKLLDPKKNALEDLGKFLKLIQPLKENKKLGSLLIQLPPKRKEELLENFTKFASNLDTSKYDFVVEFRERSWIEKETFELLRAHGLGYCMVDEPLLPPILEVTSNLAYIRWHGRGGRPWCYYEYKEEELREWKERIENIKSKAEVLYGYFNNHFRGYAPKNALQMLKILGMANNKQEEALNKVLKYFESTAIEEVKSKGLSALTTGDLNAMILAFVDKKRFERAKEEKSDVKILEMDENVVKGKVKEYDFEIRKDKKEMTHYCEDWKKRVGTKQFCKHIASVFLCMPEETSKEILKEVITKLDEWKFRF
jgi:uncharacterized protein YecE (DUF72 family)